MPGQKSLLKKIIGKIFPRFSTTDYWETRYRSGGNSGSGSYSHLAEFKAQFLNEFISSYKINSAIEFGCGDGNQLSLINYPSYVGLDVSQTSVNLCSQKFIADRSKKFLLYDPTSFEFQHKDLKADISLSLDVIFHLVEDKIFDLHMRHLFQSSLKYVVIYSSNFESKQVNHERRRQFDLWIADRCPDWKLVLKKENPFSKETNEDNQSLSDFYIYQNPKA